MVKNQSSRLTDQHKISKGVVGIFGMNAKIHDLSVGDMSKVVLKTLKDEYPTLQFRYRKSLLKKERECQIFCVNGSPLPLASF